MTILKRSEEANASDWDAFYLNGKPEWRSSGVGDISRRFLSNLSEGCSLLEIGCGAGDDAKDIIALGVKYDGIDLSAEAISQADARLVGTDANLIAADFFSWKPKKGYAAVYEKGVFHGLHGVRRRRLFVHRIASALADGGIWTTVVGAADSFDRKRPRGALLLTHLAEAVEPYFEILQILKGPYGVHDPHYDFDAWYGLFRRR